MNQQVEAIKAALAMDDDNLLHQVLVQKSQKLRQVLDKVTACVGDREDTYAKVRELRDEMTATMDAMANGDDVSELRPVTKIAADLKRANDAIDKEIDKVYTLIDEADSLRREVTEITQKIAEIPLVATAA